MEIVLEEIGEALVALLAGIPTIALLLEVLTLVTSF